MPQSPQAGRGRSSKKSCGRLHRISPEICLVRTGTNSFSFLRDVSRPRLMKPKRFSRDRRVHSRACAKSAESASSPPSGSFQEALTKICLVHSCSSLGVTACHSPLLYSPTFCCCIRTHDDIRQQVGVSYMYSKRRAKARESGAGLVSRTPCCSRRRHLAPRRTFPSTSPCAPLAGQPPFLSPPHPSPTPAIMYGTHDTTTMPVQPQKSARYRFCDLRIKYGVCSKSHTVYPPRNQ